MSDPSQQQGQPNQEEMRAYVEQLRAADPSEIVAQAFTMLGTGAEVKLGRSDARLLIDAAAALVSAVADRVPDQLREGMESGIAQLQQAQVQAEQQAGPETPETPQAPGAGAAGAGGASAAPGGPGGAQQQPGQAGQSGGDDRKMTDRLWVPGRDQPPQ